MKKSASALICIALLASTAVSFLAGPSAANASPSSAWTQQADAGNENWYGLASSADGTKLAAVSAYAANGADPGSIFTSLDSGAHWTRRTDAGTATFYSITSSADGTKLAAVSIRDGAREGSIYTSADSGVHWTERTQAGRAHFRSITSSADGKNLAAVSSKFDNGDAGRVYTSTDFGLTWSQQTVADSSEWRFITSSADGMKLAAVTYYGVYSGPGDVWTSTDAGASWQVATGLQNAYWEAITSSADGTKLAAVSDRNGSLDGSVFTSTDSGSTWTQQLGAGFSSFNNIASSSDGTRLAAVSITDSALNPPGAIYLSTDSGLTWAKQASPAREFDAIASSADGSKLAVGSVGYFDLSNTHVDAGIWTYVSPWQQQLGAPDTTWSSVASSADGTKIAATSSYGPGPGFGHVFTSTDSGVTWTQRNSAATAMWQSIASSADGTKLAAVSFAEENMNQGSVYTSSDSGLHWTKRTEAGTANWYSIASSADGKKLAAASWSDWDHNLANHGYGSIFTSIDAGAHWTKQTSAGDANWASITSSTDGKKLAAVGYPLSQSQPGSVFTSSDSGVTWNKQEGAGDQNWQAITSSADGSKLAAVTLTDLTGNQGSVYTSVDSGVTWAQQADAGHCSWKSISSSADGTILSAASFACGDNWGSVFISTDSGITWSQQIEPGPGSWRSTALNDDGSKIVAVASETPDHGPAVIWTSATATAGAPVAPRISALSPTRGAVVGSTRITITGAGFAAGATVTVGDQACTDITVLSQTLITCLTPNLSQPAGSPGAHNVVITNPSNRGAISTNGFTYVSAPTIASLSPSVGPTSGGTKITIKGTGFVFGDTVLVDTGNGLKNCTDVKIVSTTSLTCNSPIAKEGFSDVTVRDLYEQEALSFNAFQYIEPIFSGSTPETMSVRLDYAHSKLQTVTVRNVGVVDLTFSSHAVSVSGANKSSFTVLTDRCSRKTLKPQASCTVGYKFFPKRTGLQTANLLFESKAFGSTRTVAISGIGLPKKISVVTISRIKASSGSASGGTSVTIPGSGFNSAATVTIGGVGATVSKRKGSTSITVRTPAHAAGKVLVAVTNPDSGTAAYNGFTYVR